MIHPQEVLRFLDRKLDSFAWIKRIPEKVLDQELERLGFQQADPNTLPLKPHQKACIIICLANPQFALHLDMGTGKTRIILELMHHLYKNDNLPLILVLVPSEPAVFGWQDQISRWGIPFPCHAIGNSSTAEKWEVFTKAESGFLVMTYPGMARMLSLSEKSKGKSRLVRDPKAVAKFTANINAIIYDESTESGSNGTVTFRLCRALSKKAYYRYALAGRPFGRDPQMLWTQQWLVDHGETLGGTLELFRGAFFNASPGYWGGTEYKFKKKLEGKLAEILQHRSIAYASEECQNLPPVTHTIEKVRLPEDARSYYARAVEAIKKAKGNRVEINNQFLRLRQISSGFLGYREMLDDTDEKGQKAEFWFAENPKRDRLLELIHEMPQDRKAIVFYEFTPSGQSVVQALAKEKIKAGWLWSGTKDSQALLRQFDSDPAMRVLVVNWRVGSMALNLQIANYNIMYETPVSPIKRDQAEKRTFREGQLRPGFLIDLVCRGTVDERILSMLAEGEDLFEALVRDPYKLLL